MMQNSSKNYEHKQIACNSNYKETQHCQHQEQSRRLEKNTISSNDITCESTYQVRFRELSKSNDSKKKINKCLKNVTNFNNL